MHRSCAILDRSYELGAFVKCLGDNDDPMNQLVRFHSLTEVYLDLLIESYLSTHTILSKKGFVSYSRKLKVVGSHNIISSSLLESLRELTSIRNNFSHNPFTHVDEESLGNIVKDYPKRVESVS